MNEQEFIAQEQSRHDRKLLRLLRKVQNTGECGREASEVLAINDLAYFGPPRLGIRYNNWRLTDAGERLLRELQPRK